MERDPAMLSPPSIGLSGLCGLLLVLTPAAAIAETARPPDLDCSLGYDGLHSFAASLPGAQGDDGSVRMEMPDAWRVEFAFSRPGAPAHPTVTLRTFIKQVTGVWTAQSKGCGFGDQAAFAGVMADMKAGDKQLTDASRAEAERKKKEDSPLGSP